MRGCTQGEEWFKTWGPIVGEVLSNYQQSETVIDTGSAKYSMKSGHFVHLPFSGGLYEQELINPLTMEVWNHIINRITGRV